MFIFERAQVREGGREGVAERGGQRIRSRLFADGSEPDVGLELKNLKITT